MLHIYLDTSFLSELTKAGRTTTASSRSGDKWRALLTVLFRKAKREVLVCPGSEFQIQEAQCAEGLLHEYTSLQRELSRDMYFKRWDDILVNQVANQALIHLGRLQDIDPKWSAFTSQPPQPVMEPKETKRMKQNVTGYAEFVKPLREKYGRKMPYKGHHKDEKKDFLGEAFLSQNSHLTAMLLDRTGVREEEIPRLLLFLGDESNDFGSFIDIFCSLWASTYIHEPERKPQLGDSLDIVALACVIPYCQIITTDTNMKNMIKRLKFEEKYGIEVYSPTDRDLAALIEKLSSF